MCNTTATSVNSIGLNSDTIMRKAIRKQLKSRFNPQRVDEFFMHTDKEMAPEWLDVLLRDTHWRHTMYELLENYPSCAFLNFAILVSVYLCKYIYIYIN